MGWWTTNKQGKSFAQDSKNPEMVWGDSVADIMDDALDKIIKEFERTWSRVPTVEELEAGVRFSAPVLLEEAVGKG